MEGISHEFASLAGHLKLSKLILLYDDNRVSIDGPTSLTMSDNTSDRFKALGWNTINVDGYDYDQIDNAIIDAKNSLNPSLISCKTIIGRGSPNKQNTAGSHGAPLGKEELDKAKLKMNWNFDKFDIPVHILNDWRQIFYRVEAEYKDWKYKFSPRVKKIKENNKNLESNLNNIRKNVSVTLFQKMKRWQQESQVS